MPMNSVSGARLVVDAFERHKTQRVFIFPGGTIAPILDVVEKETKIEIVCPRNEQGAGYAALAYAKLTKAPAVFMVTSGPGVTNAVTPVADAYYDNVPLVVITGQVGTSDMRGTIPVKQRGFQEVDTVDLMRPIAKKVFQVTRAEDMARTIEEAFRIAGEGRQGPVVVDLPMNVQRAMVARKAVKIVRLAPTPKVPTAKIETLARWLRESERPVIIAGGGVLASGAERELRALARRHHIPVAMSLPGMGAIASDGRLSVGLLGYAGSQYANLAVYNADLVIALGTTLHVRQTGSLPEKMAPGARVARIDLDANELKHSRVPLNLAIHADVREALAKLSRSLGKAAVSDKRSEWHMRLNEWRKMHALDAGVRAKVLKPQAVIEAVDDALSRRGPVIATTGVGQHQVWVARHFTFDNPSRVLLTSSGHGTMGFDLPAALGAQIARPKATVVCFVGDGSLQMNIQELATIIDLKLDIKIVVLDNHSLNIVAQFQRQNWKSHPSTGGRYNPDFAAIARAYKIPSLTITSLKDRATLKKALTKKGPVLIHAVVDPREDLLPMLLGGHTLDDMFNDSSFTY